MDTTLDLETMLRLERRQLVEETGQDFGLGAALEDLPAEATEGAAARQAALRALYERFMPVIREADADSSSEPNDLDSILALAPAPPALGPAPAGAELVRRLHGAWLGRIAGCILGKPVEGSPKATIDQVLALAGETEITDYIPAPPPESCLAEHFALPTAQGCTRGAVDGAAPDDDINYTVLGLVVLEEHGRNFTPLDVMNAWQRYMPAGQSWTAERVAYRNFLNGYLPPESAVVTNPYREWIGAQIRADAWGYANPGNPREAAAMAWRDASISHRKNGIYGEMWAAACVAAAFSAGSIAEVLEAGLSVIPRDCRLARALRDVAVWAASDPQDWRLCWNRIMERYGDYHPVHTINNACFVALGLLFGGGDFTRTIGIAVHAGLDTDCNGATAGSILGAMIGPEGIAPHWSDPLKDTARVSLAVIGDQRITDLARRTAAVAA